MTTYLVIGRDTKTGTTLRRECTKDELATIRTIIAETLRIDPSTLVVLEIRT